MASQAQKHSSGQTSDDVKSLRTKVRQMEERIIELEKAVERIDVLEERLAQISLSHGTLQNEDRSDGASKGAECTGAKAVIPLNSWDTDIESSSPLSTTDRQSIMLSPNIMPTWSPSASDFQTCAASSSVGNFQTGETSSSVSDFETSVTSPSASRILVSQKVGLAHLSRCARRDSASTPNLVCSAHHVFYSVMHQYSDQLPLIEKKWSDLSEDLKAQLVSSLVGNLKFNKIPVPREQLKRKRLKDYYASRRNTVLTKGNAEKTKKRRLALKRSRLTLFARDKAVKDAIEAGEVDAKNIESIKKIRAAVPTVPLSETLAAGSDDEEEERTVYQKKRLLSLEVARASRVRGVGAGTSHSHEHEIAHRPELTAAGAATSSNSDTD
eukprot:Em0020g606a